MMTPDELIVPRGCRSALRESSRTSELRCPSHSPPDVPRGAAASSDRTHSRSVDISSRAASSSFHCRASLISWLRSVVSPLRRGRLGGLRLRDPQLRLRDATPRLLRGDLRFELLHGARGLRAEQLVLILSSATLY